LHLISSGAKLNETIFVNPPVCQKNDGEEYARFKSKQKYLKDISLNLLRTEVCMYKH